VVVSELRGLSNNTPHYYIEVHKTGNPPCAILTRQSDRLLTFYGLAAFMLFRYLSLKRS
jgi:hypothetical protein